MPALSLASSPVLPGMTSQKAGSGRRWRESEAPKQVGQAQPASGQRL